MAKYSEDEFDRLAAERTSYGAHRKVSPINPWIIALVAVLLIAPLLGWLLGNALSDSGEPTADETTTSEVATEPTDGETSDDASTEPTDGETSDDATAEPTDGEPGDGETTDDAATEPTDEPSEEPTDEIDYSTEVRVLNGRGVAGWAAENAGILNGAGFANTTTGDYAGGAAPANSTVYYASEDVAEEAQAVADALGVTAVQDGSAMGLSAPIVVVMR